MKYLDLTLSTPAENLAADEVLLDVCEDAEGEEGVLRIYESPVPFVVIGYGNRRASEVNLEACEAAGVPVLRRISGGGAVVLGPGCLAYALVLPMGGDPALASVTGANRLIMERQRRTLQGLVGSAVRVEGITDLTVGDRKVGGNSQRRRRRMILFHGTLLLDFDLASIGRFLCMPTLRPAYRKDRGHHEFVANLGLAAEEVKEALRREWRAEERWECPIDHAAAELVNTRYGRREWNERR